MKIDEESGKKCENPKNKRNQKQELFSEISLDLGQKNKNYIELSSDKCTFKEIKEKLKRKISEKELIKKKNNTCVSTIKKNAIRKKEKNFREKKNKSFEIRENRNETETETNKNTEHEMKNKVKIIQRKNSEYENKSNLKLLKKDRKVKEQENTAEMFNNSTMTGEKIMFMTMKSEPKSFKETSIFFIKKNIDMLCGEVHMAKKIRDGRLIIKTKTIQQAQKLQQAKTLANIEVETTYDIKSNQGIGVIFNRDLKYSTDEEIVENLKAQGVSAVRRHQKKDNAGNTFDSGLFFLTFDNAKVPEEIKVGYEIVKVRLFIPEPMRCFICLKFGHTKLHCQETEAKCGNCYQQVHTNKETKEKCVKKQKCGNCGEKNAWKLR